MEAIHLNIITSHMNSLEQANLERLVPKLISNEVFTAAMIDRIFTNAKGNDKLKTISIFLETTKRGPRAFNNLITALLESDHTHLATALLRAEEEANRRVPNDGSIALENGSVKMSASSSSLNAEDLPDSMHMCRIQQSYPRASLPAPLINGYAHASHFTRDELKSINEPLPLHGRQGIVVQNADKLMYSDGELPEKYRMTSNPRGFALIINNIVFEDEADYPTRNGAKNDERDMSELLKQLYFQVELHTNKTRQEMVQIVEAFSQKEEWRTVDCAFIVLMSHGKEGESEEDTEIVGTDGLGFKTRDVISYFYNDSCPRLRYKPKIFIFQSCRGSLCDRGVEVDPFDDNPLPAFRRTETDGRVQPKKVRDRSRSDIFVAHPVPPGIKANRDRIWGAWFIQAIVDVFSKYAQVCDLEDLFKIVDLNIKKQHPPGEPNYQTVTTRTMGWNKKLYFNPGLHYENNRLVRADEGMDVVDTPSDSQSHYSNREDLIKLTTKDEPTAGCFSCKPC